MITDGERRAYDQAINGLLKRTRGNLKRARSLGANPGRTDRITRAEAFLTQAEQMRQQDPAGAKSLLERAELLSREAAEP